MDNENTINDKNTIENESTLIDERTIKIESTTSEKGSPDQATGSQVEAQPLADSSRFSTIRSRLRSVSRFVLYAIILLIGFVLGMVAVLLFQLAISGNKSPFPPATPPVSSGNVTVHADESVITPLLQKSVQEIDLPANGSITNVQVQFANGAQMTITGNYQLTVLNVPVTRPFTLDLQLLANNCQLQIHILQADFSGIPLTGLVALFEDKINQKLDQLIPQNPLPGNISYCMINVATDTQGITATLYLVILSTTPTANVIRPFAIL